LHGARQGQAVRDKKSTTVSDNTADGRGKSPAAVNTYCIFEGKPTNYVLLATAIVEVNTKFNQYIPCRVLIDSGSQMNFITEGCVQKLGLSRTQTPVSIQGINDVNTTHHSFSIHMRSRHSDWHTTVNCTSTLHK
jgi:hypothetical protein